MIACARGRAEERRNGLFPFQETRAREQLKEDTVCAAAVTAAQDLVGVAKLDLLLPSPYAIGHGVPQDYVQAYKWLNLTASRLPASETGKRDKAFRDRDLVAAHLTPAQIAEAQKLAREWKPR